MRKIIACSRVSLFPPEHGGAKNLRAVVEALAADGVECKVLVQMTSAKRRFAGQHIDELKALGLETPRWQHRAVSYLGVENLPSEFANLIESENPDRVLLLDDAIDEAFELFDIAARSDRLVFLAQTVHSLPFGEFALAKYPRTAEAIRCARKILAPSEYVGEYVRTVLRREVAILRPQVFGQTPPILGRLTNPCITMINPCAWKGLSIFLALATGRTDQQFAAVPTWGATAEVLEKIRGLSNITILQETSQVDEIYSKTKILLAPSLCQEAFGLVAPEALLRGIPVIASDIAGLRESTLGVSKTISVEPLSFAAPPPGTDPTKFRWEEPLNPVEPWSEAIDNIVRHYEVISERGAIRAREFAEEVNRQSITKLIFD